MMMRKFGTVPKFRTFEKRCNAWISEVASEYCTVLSQKIWFLRQILKRTHNQTLSTFLESPYSQYSTGTQKSVGTLRRIPPSPEKYTALICSPLGGGAKCVGNGPPVKRTRGHEGVCTFLTPFIRLPKHFVFSAPECSLLALEGRTG